MPSRKCEGRATDDGVANQPLGDHRAPEMPDALGTVRRAPPGEEADALVPPPIETTSSRVSARW